MKLKMSIINRLSVTIILFFGILTATGCSDSTDEADDTIDIISATEAEKYLETGDLRQIKKHKQLRILTKSIDQTWLPRDGQSFDDELNSAIQFAKSINLKPLLIYVDRFEDLIPALNEGRGDIIAANMTITDSRKEVINFSVPLVHSREYIVSRKNDNIRKLSDLNGRNIAVFTNTSHQETLEKLRLKQPEIKFTLLQGDLSEDELLDMLNNRQIDLTIMDKNRIDIISSYREDFKNPIALTAERAIAWGMRESNKQLVQEANRFLTDQILSTKQQHLYTDDLEQIKKRKTLRVITRNNAASYFLWRGELMGFEYELVKKFAAQHDLRIEVITAPTHDAQIPMLLEGKGDIIASFMTITDSRKAQNIQFSRPYHRTVEVIISRSKDKIIHSLDDIKGRTLYVRKSSSYWNTLQNLQQQGHQFKIVSVDENMETEEIIDHVASGKYDLTIADSHILDIELTWRDDIKAAFTLEREREHAWAMRKENTKLHKAVNSFLKKQYRSLFYNITYQKYFKDLHTIREYREERIDLNPKGQLSPYDKLVKKYASQYQFDWRLITAQMYQESRFKPNAKSWAGAKGLMQVMPRTAKEVGIKNLEDPESGIKAGIIYLDWVRDRFEPELSVKDRMWFILAAYNAGHGHVRDARRLARQQGLNPDKWFENVEKAMLLLSRREHARKARHGYVRGSEPVNYVRNIRKRYYAYIQLTDNGR